MRKWMWAILLFVPVIELFGFILMSDWIGAGKTLLLMILTSLIGIAMLQFEGRKVLSMPKPRWNAVKCLDGKW